MGKTLLNWIYPWKKVIVNVKLIYSKSWELNKAAWFKHWGYTILCCQVIRWLCYLWGTAGLRSRLRIVLHAFRDTEWRLKPCVGHAISPVGGQDYKNEMGNMPHFFLFKLMHLTLTPIFYWSKQSHIGKSKVSGTWMYILSAEKAWQSLMTKGVDNES